jgi:hypothetical protein
VKLFDPPPEDWISFDPPSGWPTGWANEEPGDPVLVLATDRVLSFRPGRDWHPIRHQTSGIGCHQRIWMATLLTPRPHIREAMIRMDERWHDSQVGMFGVALSDINEYAAFLRDEFGPWAGCESSYGLFEESHYPIDVSQDALKELCEDVFPGDLDDLVDWDGHGKMERLFGSIGRWKLLVLGANSD